MKSNSLTKTITVKQRLMTLGVAAFMGIGTMVAVGWYEQVQVEAGLKEANSFGDKVEVINTLRVDALELDLAAMDTIVDKDEGSVTPERLKIFAETSKGLAEGVPGVVDLAKLVNKPELASTFAADVATLSKLVTSDLRSLVEKKADEEAFHAIDDVIDRAADKVTGTLAELAKLGGDLTEQKINETNALTQQSVYVQFGFGLLAMTVIALLQRVHAGAIRRGLSNIIESMNRIVGGDYHTTVSGTESSDEIGEMARATDVFRKAGLEKQELEARSHEDRRQSERERLERDTAQRTDAEAIRAAVDALASSLTRLTDGDLSTRIERPFREDLEPVRADFNRLTDKLREMMAQISGNSSSIQANAQQMRSAADDLAKRTEQQAAALEETSASLEQITRTVQTSTQRAEGASTMVNNTKQFAEKSTKVVADAMSAMERIEQANGEIGKIINVVDEIAFQTNLLALNAGVEAARAGEAGKGFAVVAQEVRELAGRAAGAAKDIKSLVSRSTHEVQTGVDLVRATGEALHHIGDDVMRINDDVGAIVTSAREQFVGLSEINSAISQMDQTTQKNAAMVEETNASSHALASDAENLARLMSQFRIEGSTPRAVEASTAPSQPRPSPARNLINKVASAMTSQPARKVAGASSDKWEEF
ncbi:methyl-accepting chemotaxis protein [Rhizobium oryzicola]|uniref:Methyl-accepting chemotaxis protein n=1 Tax=Rhizobium oryzicola TaxID=1232668 RepID=A0ABT8T1R4_9HYPH|nr:methyl-accepting chemotaxis protein [Rhizobium oryzicola]MDO1584480.1 methyl-accepting chemotaxis protein [Rhizobium oryzicola]